MVESVRAFILPHVTGHSGAIGSSYAQKLRCRQLDLFFKYFPLLGSSSQYSICMPLVAWACGDWFALRIYLGLCLTFFWANGAKDLLRLPRPKKGIAGVAHLETGYLEEYGFPLTHSANAVIWAAALCETLNTIGFEKSLLIPFVGFAYVLLIGFSRLYLGVHSLADLLGGLQVGFMATILTNSVLAPLALAVMEDPDASKTYTLLVREVTVDGSCLVAAALCGLLALYPDKRDRWTTYADLLSIIGVAAGWMAAAGPRFRASNLVPAGGAVVQGGDVSTEALLVALGSCYAGLGLVRAIGSACAGALQRRYGFCKGTFKLIKSLAMGFFLGWAADGGMYHIKDASLCCSAAVQELRRWLSEFKLR